MVGVLPKPYYWWEAGAFWGSFMDYGHLTGDTAYQAILSQALESQIGPDFNFMLTAQTYDEGNDDQSFWGFTAMSAAEQNFPQPTSGGHSW